MPAASWSLAVTAAGPARADLRITVSAPAKVAPGAAAAVAVTVSNAGPSAAAKVATAVVVPRGWRVTDPAGGVVAGTLVVIRAVSLDPGASATYSVKFMAGPDRRTDLLAALTLSGTPDPNYRTNIAVAVTKVQ